MKINNYIIRISSLMILIFGGGLIIRYLIVGKLQIENLIFTIIGIVILIISLIWRKNKI